MSKGINSYESMELVLPDHSLTSRQVQVVTDYRSDCPILRIHGSVQIISPVGNFEKGFSAETRAFIYRGNI